MRESLVLGRDYKGKKIRKLNSEKKKVSNVPCWRQLAWGSCRLTRSEMFHVIALGVNIWLILFRAKLGVGTKIMDAASF